MSQTDDGELDVSISEVTASIALREIENAIERVPDSKSADDQIYAIHLDEARLELEDALGPASGGVVHSGQTDRAAAVEGSIGSVEDTGYDSTVGQFANAHSSFSALNVHSEEDGEGIGKVYVENRGHVVGLTIEHEGRDGYQVNAGVEARPEHIRSLGEALVDRADELEAMLDG